MLTVQQVYNQVLGECFGIEVGIPSPGRILPSISNRVLFDIQAVRDTMYLKAGPDKLLKRQGGALLFAPLILSNISVTQNANTISGSQLTSAMDGCTCQIGDDPAQNKLVQTGSGSFQLVAPFNGTTTTGADGIVWYDALTLPANVLSIERPVEIENQWELMPLTNPIGTRTSALWLDGYNDYGRVQNVEPGGYPSTSGPRQSATPANYYVEWVQLYTGAYASRMRVDAMPDTIYTLKYWYRVRPSAITSATDTTTLLVPNGMDESIFLPLVRARCATHPKFTGDIPALKEDAAQAMVSLERLTNNQPLNTVEIDTLSGF